MKAIVWFLVALLPLSGWYYLSRRDKKRVVKLSAPIILRAGIAALFVMLLLFVAFNFNGKVI